MCSSAVCVSPYKEHPNFGELRLGEVRRILLLGRWVNLAVSEPAGACGHPPPSKDRGDEALASPEPAEERPHVTDQKLGVLHGSEVAAARDLRPAPDVAEEPLRRLPGKRDVWGGSLAKRAIPTGVSTRGSVSDHECIPS